MRENASRQEENSKNDFQAELSEKTDFPNDNHLAPTINDPDQSRS